MALSAGPGIGYETAASGSLHHQGNAVFFSVWDYIALSSINDLWEVPPDWSTHTVLALEAHEWLNFISTKLRCHEGPFIYATGTVFKG
jgi:hypothetical protein